MAAWTTPDQLPETMTDAFVEGRAMWSSVRDALCILLGGNFGEITFTVGTGLLSARDTLNARHLGQPAHRRTASDGGRRRPTAADQLLTERSEASLGSALTRENGPTGPPPRPVPPRPPGCSPGQ